MRARVPNAGNVFAIRPPAAGMDVSTRGRAVFALGGVLTALGVAGYAAGVVTAYSGRSFTVTAVMVGVTLLAVGNALRPEGAG